MDDGINCVFVGNCVFVMPSMLPASGVVCLCGWVLAVEKVVHRGNLFVLQEGGCLARRGIVCQRCQNGDPVVSSLVHTCTKS